MNPTLGMHCMVIYFPEDSSLGNNEKEDGEFYENIKRGKGKSIAQVSEKQ